MEPPWPGGVGEDDLVVDGEIIGERPETGAGLGEAVDEDHPIRVRAAGQGCSDRGGQASIGGRDQHRTNLGWRSPWQHRPNPSIGPTPTVPLTTARTSVARSSVARLSVAR